MPSMAKQKQCVVTPALYMVAQVHANQMESVSFSRHWQVETPKLSLVKMRTGEESPSSMTSTVMRT